MHTLQVRDASGLNVGQVSPESLPVIPLPDLLPIHPAIRIGASEH